MGNYKNKKYPDTLAGFKDWCRDFPPLERGTKVRYYEKDGLYLCLEHVRGSYSGGGGYDFIGVTLKRYDSDDLDFDWVGMHDPEIAPLKPWLDERIARYEQVTGSKYYG